MYTSVHVCRAGAAETKRHLKSQKKKKKKQNTLQNKKKKSAEKKMDFPLENYPQVIVSINSQYVGFPKFCPL